MAVITYLGTEYTVDHAVKGADFIHGYDADSVMVVSFEGINDFSGFSYNGTYMEPEHCLAEGCNDVKFVGGKWQTRDGKSLLRTVSITFSTSWTASDSNYTQTVTVNDGTANSLVSLQPTVAQIVALQSAGVAALVVDNNNGTFTATAVGAKPTAAMNIQATLTEVSA